jgi:hypothetical protein
MRADIRRSVAALLAALACTSSATAAPPGTTIDFAPGTSERDRTTRTWQGRAWLHPAVSADPQRPRPLIVFMHGLNTEKIPFRWMGGAPDPDVREMVASLIDQHMIEPAILVAPTTTYECEMPRSMWPAFDLDRFLALALRNLDARAAVDRGRVVLVGHSGAACNTAGGMITALRGGFPVRAALVIDTCMDVAAAPLLALAPPSTDIVVAWQPLGWNRPFNEFEHVFLETSTARYSKGIRKVQRIDLNVVHAHNAIVAVALQRWLPVWLSRDALSRL